MPLLPWGLRAGGPGSEPPASSPPSLSSRDPCPAPPRGLQDTSQGLSQECPRRPHLGGATRFLPVPPTLFSSKTTQLTPPTPRPEPHLAPESVSCPARALHTKKDAGTCSQGASLPSASPDAHGSLRWPDLCARSPQANLPPNPVHAKHSGLGKQLSAE